MRALYKIFILSGLIFAFMACNKEDEWYVLEDQPDEMHVVASTDSIVLLQEKSSDVAIKFTWDAIPSQDSVSYALQLYMTADMNNSYTDYYELGTATEYSFTHSELNAIIQRWALAGDPVGVTARIVGTVHNELKYIKPEVSTVAFTAVGWELYTTYLFLHTSMNSNVIMLEQAQMGTGVYSTTMTFSPCFYHFTTTESADYPAYYMGPDGKLLYVAEEGEYNEFENDLDPGTYTMIVDVNADYLDSRILYVQMQAGDMPYMYGDGCDIGWVLKSSDGYMSQSSDPRTPYIYSWTGNFYIPGDHPSSTAQEGQFKVTLSDSGSTNVFFAPYAGADPLIEHELLPARDQGDYDYKWRISQDGRYTFSINVVDMVTSFEPE